jgi:hypothetical protein
LRTFHASTGVNGENFVFENAEIDEICANFSFDQLEGKPDAKSGSSNKPYFLYRFCILLGTFFRQPCGAIGGHASQNTPFRHKIGIFFPCCRRVSHLCKRRRCRRNKKRTFAIRFSRSLRTIFCLYFELCTIF